jgi:hypothetical protein
VSAGSVVSGPVVGTADELVLDAGTLVVETLDVGEVDVGVVDVGEALVGADVVLPSSPPHATATTVITSTPTSSRAFTSG